MKTISLTELRLNLDDYLEQAHQGMIFEITKYNKPYAKLEAIPHSFLHIGKNSQRGQLRSIVEKDTTNGAWLACLLQDRMS